jgi:hypothetical protein
MRRCEVVAVALAAGVIAAATSAHADGWRCGDPIPAGVHPVVREDRTAVSIGATLFAASYAGSVFAAADSFVAVADTSPTHGELWIPVVGPFASLGAGRSHAADAVLVLDGLAQAGGLALVVYAIAWPERVLVPDAPGAIAVAPLVGDATGAMVSGRF